MRDEFQLIREIRETLASEDAHSFSLAEVTTRSGRTVRGLISEYDRERIIRTLAAEIGMVGERLDLLTILCEWNDGDATVLYVTADSIESIRFPRFCCSLDEVLEYYTLTDSSLWAWE